MTSFVNGHDGVRLRIAVDDGDGAGILMSHATGFCLDVWDPVVADLRGLGVSAPVARWDHRFHGDSGRAASFDWWDAGRDALTVIDALGWGTVGIGVGHSYGGAALVLAELLRPGTFTRLLLIEPIIFPGPYERFPDQPLVVMSRKRTPSFPSRAAAFENYENKGPFARWDKRALDAYVDGGFVEHDGAWRLKCDPDDEAETFLAATMHAAWERLGEVRCPVFVVAGEHSDSHPTDYLAAQTGRFPNAVHDIVDDASHFLPMEQPGRVAELIRDHIGVRNDPQKESAGPVGPAGK